MLLELDLCSFPVYQWRGRLHCVQILLESWIDSIPLDAGHSQTLDQLLNNVAVNLSQGKKQSFCRCHFVNHHQAVWDKRLRYCKCLGDGETRDS